MDLIRRKANTPFENCFSDVSHWSRFRRFIVKGWSISSRVLTLVSTLVSHSKTQWQVGKCFTQHHCCLVVLLSRWPGWQYRTRTSNASTSLSVPYSAGDRTSFYKLCIWSLHCCFVKTWIEDDVVLSQVIDPRNSIQLWFPEVLWALALWQTHFCSWLHWGCPTFHWDLKARSHSQEH